LLVASAIHAQEVRLFTNLLKNIDLSHPQASGGIELKKGRNSFSISGGYFYNNYMFQEKSNGFSIGTEYKFHNENSLYYSLNIDYARINYETSNSFMIDNDTSDFYPTYLDDYKVEKTRFDISANLGYRLEIKKLYFDCFGGIGVRVKNTEHSNRERQEDVFDPVFRLINIRDKEGKNVTPILRLGILIGIKI
jgi:hypothetical protein